MPDADRRELDTRLQVRYNSERLEELRRLARAEDRELADIVREALEPLHARYQKIKEAFSDG